MSWHINKININIELTRYAVIWQVALKLKRVADTIDNSPSITLKQRNCSKVLQRERFVIESLNYMIMVRIFEHRMECLFSSCILMVKHICIYRLTNTKRCTCPIIFRKCFWLRVINCAVIPAMRAFNDNLIMNTFHQSITISTKSIYKLFFTKTKKKYRSKVMFATHRMREQKTLTISKFSMTLYCSVLPM